MPDLKFCFNGRIRLETRLELQRSNRDEYRITREEVRRAKIGEFKKQQAKCNRYILAVGLQASKSGVKEKNITVINMSSRLNR